MSHDNPLDVLDAGRKLAPEAIRRVADATRSDHKAMEDPKYDLPDEILFAAESALEDEGWFTDSNGFSFPLEVRLRAVGHPDWNGFLGKHGTPSRLEAQDELGYFCRLYVWAHERNLL